MLAHALGGEDGRSGPGSPSREAAGCSADSIGRIADILGQAADRPGDGRERCDDLTGKFSGDAVTLRLPDAAERCSALRLTFSDRLAVLDAVTGKAFPGGVLCGAARGVRESLDETDGEASLALRKIWDIAAEAYLKGKPSDGERG